MEFKGTKGKWEVVLLEETEFSLRKNEIHFGKDGECVAEYVHNDYDALLISKAPEMLEFLNHVINTLPNGSSIQEKAKQLIKEATEF